MVIEDGIETEVVKKWQDNDWACSNMKEWIMKWMMDCQLIPKQFKMCYKSFHVENNFMYS